MLTPIQMRQQNTLKPKRFKPLIICIDYLGLNNIIKFLY